MADGKSKILGVDRSNGERYNPEKMSKVTGFDLGWLLVISVAILLLLLIVTNPDTFLSILVFVSDGLIITITVTIVSFILMLFVGLIGGLGRSSKNPIIYGISSLYVEIVRGIPLLVQLIWWYFAFPVVLQSVGELLGIAPLANFHANPIAMAILGLTVCYGAYMSEIVRAGIQSIPVGQMEAARSIGMTHFQGLRFIIIPQAIRVILPPVGNELIALLKDSALVSVVAVADLTRRGREFMSSHFNPIEVWTLVALVYLLMTLFAARVVRWLENRSETT